jgi:hypothetical protein
MSKPLSFSNIESAIADTEPKLAHRCQIQVLIPHLCQVPLDDGSGHDARSIVVNFDVNIWGLETDSKRCPLHFELEESCQKKRKEKKSLWIPTV